jgi:biopolymer transport protein ExbB
MGDLFGSMFKAFDAGGFGMYPISIALIFSIAIVVERVYTLYFRSAIDKDTFLKNVRRHVFAGDLDKAIAYCAGQKKVPLVSVVKAGLASVPRGDDDVQAAMDEATLRESPRLERRTGYLAMISNIATLLGLLGTIIGLIHSFGAVANANPADKATILAQGISEAMYCTAFGLSVAIPTLILYSVLQGRTQAMVDDINESSVSVLNLVVANRDKMKMPASQVAAAVDAEA